jgi:nucleotide-binding universal stress UspA family protein
VKPLLGRADREGRDDGVAQAPRRVLFPFVGSVLSEPTLEATLRIARARGATLMPAYVAIVPRNLSLDAPLGNESAGALALLEVIEQRAAKAEVDVDSRIVRGRTARHAVQLLIRDEDFDSIVIPARTGASDGFDPADVAWVLESAPGEVLVLRPGSGSRDAQPSRSAVGGAR